MKLLFAVLKDNDVDVVIQALTKDEFRVTRVASTGGFFHRGSTTLLIGVDDEKVDDAIKVVREKTTIEPNEQKRATVFVVPVSRFEQL